MTTVLYVDAVGVNPKLSDPDVPFITVGSYNAPVPVSSTGITALSFSYSERLGTFLKFTVPKSECSATEEDAMVTNLIGSVYVQEVNLRDTYVIRAGTVKNGANYFRFYLFLEFAGREAL